MGGVPGLRHRAVCQNALLNDQPTRPAGEEGAGASYEDDPIVITVSPHHPADIHNALWLLNQRDENISNVFWNDLANWFNNDPRSKAVQAALAAAAAIATFLGLSGSDSTDGDNSRDGSHPFDASRAVDMGPLQGGGRIYQEHGHLNPTFVTLGPDNVPYARLTVVNLTNGQSQVFVDRGFDGNYESSYVVPHG